MDHFELHSNYSPTGDQPQAIKELTDGILRGDKEQTRLGQDVYDGEHHRELQPSNAGSGA